MKPSITKIQKFFKLEAERGYDNHAVVGGLERIVERWEAEARLDGVSEELIQFVVARLRDYPRLASPSRAEVLEGLRRRISREMEGERLEPASPRPRPEKAPVYPPAAPVKKDEDLLPPTQPAPPPEENVSGGEEEAAPEAVVESEAEEDPTTSPAQDSVREGEEVEEAPSLETAAAVAGEETEEAVQVEEPALPRVRTVLPAVEQAVEPAALNAPVTVLPGVGPRHAQTLSRLGLQTLRDMLYDFPRRYDDYSRLKPINRLWYGDEVTLIATVQSVSSRPVRSGKMQVTEAVVSDGTGALRVNWFNQPWIGKRLQPGAHISLSGKVEQYLGRLVMNGPEWEPLEQQQLSTNRIVPVYALTAQITQRWMRRMMSQVISYWAPRVPDPLPESLRKRAGLMDLTNAIYQAHFPDTIDLLNAARHRLAFDEIFLLQLGVLRQKRQWQERSGTIFTVTDGWLQSQVAALPFPLTGAQLRALADIRQDLVSGKPMNRLVQGDVGSGKTVVAALGAAMVVSQGGQAAIMSPTSILAEQHYRTLLRLLAGMNGREVEKQVAGPATQEIEEGAEAAEVAAWEGEGGQVAPEKIETVQDLSGEVKLPEPAPPLLQPAEIRLMIGATPEAEKREIRQGLADGSIKIVVGTHALIEEPVGFANLQFVVVDEQHRFGVEQRAALRSKGTNPHLLVMTATPIPRSLALTVYGDLDLSVIDEMPPGRQPVGTYVLAPKERERAYTLIRSQVAAGNQAFIIYPLVEESDKSDSKAAVEEHARLQRDIFPRLRLGLLHGRVSPEEKEVVMSRFRDRELDVLVSTSVVEVGVDIPNATVMLIEGADRFGLAQLHQFRGRVGRGAEKAYCLLIPEKTDAMENERLQAMAQTNDGFLLAEKDLDQRGPGEFLGTRQSGYSELQLASLTDVRLIEKARRFAQEIFQQDPDLNNPEHATLAAALERFWGQPKGDIS